MENYFIEQVSLLIFLTLQIVNTLMDVKMLISAFDPSNLICSFSSQTKRGKNPSSIDCYFLFGNGKWFTKVN